MKDVTVTVQCLNLYLHYTCLHYFYSTLLCDSSEHPYHNSNMFY